MHYFLHYHCSHNSGLLSSTWLNCFSLRKKNCRSGPELTTLNVSSHHEIRPLIKDLAAVPPPELKSLTLAYTGHRKQIGATVYLGRAKMPKLERLNLTNISSTHSYDSNCLVGQGWQSIFRTVKYLKLSDPAGNHDSRASARVMAHWVQALRGHLLKELRIEGESSLILSAFAEARFPQLKLLSLDMAKPHSGPPHTTPQDTTDDDHDLVSYYDDVVVERLSSTDLNMFFQASMPQLEHLKLFYCWEDSWLKWREAPIVLIIEGEDDVDERILPSIKKIDFSGLSISGEVLEEFLGGDLGSRCSMNFSNCKKEVPLDFTMGLRAQEQQEARAAEVEEERTLGLGEEGEDFIILSI